MCPLHQIQEDVVLASQRRQRAGTSERLRLLRWLLLIHLRQTVLPFLTHVSRLPDRRRGTLPDWRRHDSLDEWVHSLSTSLKIGSTETQKTILEHFYAFWFSSTLEFPLRKMRSLLLAACCKRLLVSSLMKELGRTDGRSWVTSEERCCSGFCW